MKEKIDVYQIITDRIIAMLEKGTVPWQKSWVGSGSFATAPRNLISGKAYRGVNFWMLAGTDYASNYWLTYKQAQGLGGNPRKGEKATPVVFWKRLEVEDTNSVTGKKMVWFLRYYSVFNVDQCENIPAAKLPKAPAPLSTKREHTPIETAEAVVANMPKKPDVRHGGGRAYYSPGGDYVGMPAPESFKDSEAYYSTLFHELTHATGHSSRLDRKGITGAINFGSEPYAQEELVAEMGAAFLCGHIGIESATVDNSASYIAGWLEKLRDDRKLVVQAAGQAQKAVDFILGTKFEEEKSEAAD